MSLKDLSVGSTVHGGSQLASEQFQFVTVIRLSPTQLVVRDSLGRQYRFYRESGDAGRWKSVALLEGVTKELTESIQHRKLVRTVRAALMDCTSLSIPTLKQILALIEEARKERHDEQHD